jgi:hypothetical protein
MTDRARPDRAEAHFSDEKLVDLAVAKATIEVESRLATRQSGRWQRDAALIGAGVVILGGAVSYFVSSTERRLEEKIASQAVAVEQRLNDRLAGIDKSLTGKVETEVKAEATVISERFVGLESETTQRISDRMDVFQQNLIEKSQLQIDGLQDRLESLDTQIISIKEREYYEDVKSQFLTIADKINSGSSFVNEDAESALHYMVELADTGRDAFGDAEILTASEDLIFSFISARREDYAERSVDIMGDRALQNPTVVVAVLLNVSSRLLGFYADASQWPEPEVAKLHNYIQAARTIRYPEYAILFGSLAKFREQGDQKSVETSRILEELYDIQEVEAGYVIYHYFYRSEVSLWTPQPRRRDERVAEVYDGFWRAHKDELRELVKARPAIEEDVLSRIEDGERDLLYPKLCEAFGKNCASL